MKEKIRDQIIQYLKKRESASALDLSKALSASKTNIQYHIRKLIKEHIIETNQHSQKQTNNTGRPTHYYSLIKNDIPDNINNLARAILKTGILKNELGLDNVAKNMITINADPKKNFTINIKKLVDLLNEQEYQAHWEAHQKGPIIIFKNCPYREHLAENPELCLLDLQILKSNLGAEITQTARINMSLPNSQCAFYINR